MFVLKLELMAGVGVCGGRWVGQTYLCLSFVLDVCSGGPLFALPMAVVCRGLRLCWTCMGVRVEQANDRPGLNQYQARATGSLAEGPQ